MPLTVKEKEHWKERIAMKIEKAIENAYRDEGNGLRENIRQQAKTRAMKHYGLEDYMRRYSSRKAQIEALQSQQFRASEEASKPLESMSRHCWSDRHSLIVGVIDRAAKDVEKEILQESEVGRKILRLEREREELIDTIWLATSTVQIQSLWKDFSAMLTEEPTELQKQALTYEPLDDSKSE
ncbi:MAG: hypothetical protein WKF77_22660 [Planctomycetaceae bacterium]